MGNAEPVELHDRAGDRGRAVIDVVGEPDRGNPGDLECLPGNLRIGEKAFAFDRMGTRRLVETAFEIGEDQVGRAHLLTDPRKRHGRVRSIHQVHIADQDHRRHLECLPMIERAQRVSPAA